MAAKAERLLGQFFAIFDNRLHVMHPVDWPLPAEAEQLVASALGFDVQSSGSHRKIRSAVAFI